LDVNSVEWIVLQSWRSASKSPSPQRWRQSFKQMVCSFASDLKLSFCNRSAGIILLFYLFIYFLNLFHFVTHIKDIHLHRDIIITISRKCCDRRRKQKLNSNWYSTP
jgi:hypothetical protein